ncbi:hypothetical protein QJQ45_005392 [Haematococcus lacustris]|nr:hypothetical protein QJQ45_005392 [Haematococcus lacustris]
MAAPSPDDPNALGSDGLPKFAHTTSQTFGGKKSTVAQVYNQLKGCTVRANYVVRISLIKKLVVIACLLCNKELGIINPTDSQCKHDEHSKRKGAPMEQHDVAKKMVMFVASAGVTFACLDNPFLRAVFASFDAVCPTAKQARTTGLRDAYGELCRVVGAELDEMLQDHPFPARTTPSQQLLGVIMTKQFYVDLHNRMANEVTKGHPEQLLGVIMDGPSVNRAALNDLAFQHPTWICMTCCVHSMNLICKDLSNESSTASKHTPVGVFLKQVQRISKVLSDGGKINHALHMAQHAKYNAIRHVASHCPTRFAILYKICVDIERSEDAFRMMVESGDWVHVAASCANSDVFEDMKTGMYGEPASLPANQPHHACGAMVRQANSIIRTSRTVTEPGQPTVTYIADLDNRRAFWSVTSAKQFPILAKAAVRLLSVHVSTAAAERNWSVWTSIYRNGLRSKLSVEQAEKLVYLKANSRDETDTLTLPKDVRINNFA